MARQFECAFQQCRRERFKFRQLLSGDLHRGAIKTGQASQREGFKLQADRARLVTQGPAGEHWGQLSQTSIEFGEEGRQFGENRGQFNAFQLGQTRLPPGDGLRKSSAQRLEALPQMAVLADLVALRSLGLEGFSKSGQLLEHLGLEPL